ncbi:unnamed protein product [Rhizoctonia solani]|uniref:Uncharacterized protein n=1 Tax=Rhizoctonia solani TaxID=456999 RepID=A0A8H3D810_9AGAM|nr:unnamed protein product [Rhizoctonia solani]
MASTMVILSNSILNLSHIYLGSKRRRQVTVTVSNLDTEPSKTDNQWTDLPEQELVFGPRPDRLARLITRPCCPYDEEHAADNHHFWRVYDSHCHWTKKSIDWQLNRIYKHSARCSAPQCWIPDSYHEAKVALANMALGDLQPLSSVKAKEFEPDLPYSAYHRPMLTESNSDAELANRLGSGQSGCFDDLFTAASERKPHPAAASRENSLRTPGPFQPLILISKMAMHMP